MAHEMNDDTLDTAALSANARIWGAASAGASEPKTFSREAFLNYLIAALATVASSGSASDLSSGTLPLGRLHGRIADFAEIGTYALGDLFYFNGTDIVKLAVGSENQELRVTSGVPAWATIPSLASDRGLRVVTAAGAVNMLAGDEIVVVNKTIGAATVVNLSSSPVVGRVYTVKDGKGDAATNNITLTPASGTIDGDATGVMAVNYLSVDIIWNGTQWNALSVGAAEIVA